MYQGHQMEFTNSDINKMFGMEKTPRTLIKAEEEGRIPKATRMNRGKVSVRVWPLDLIPFIGEKYGFLKRPMKQQVISVFVAKGGVLKTTITYNFARILALHNIKTIIVGVDVQESITSLVIGKNEVENLNDFKLQGGLYELLVKKTPVEDLIRKSDIPTLDVMPENSNLTLLDFEITKSPRMVDVFKEKLLAQLANYDVVLFDSSPNFNNLTKNILTASNHVIAPISCEIGTYQALEQNLQILNNFKDEAGLKWESYQMVPTLLDNNKLSKQIQGSFIGQFPENITETTIKRTAKGQEASAISQSIFEYMPKSDLASNYRELYKELWGRINQEVH